MMLAGPSALTLLRVAAPAPEDRLPASLRPVILSGEKLRVKEFGDRRAVGHQVSELVEVEEDGDGCADIENEAHAGILRLAPAVAIESDGLGIDPRKIVSLDGFDLAQQLDGDVDGLCGRQENSVLLGSIDTPCKDAVVVTLNLGCGPRIESNNGHSDSPSGRSDADGETGGQG